jgi:hypothetical protein
VQGTKGSALSFRPSNQFLRYACTPKLLSSPSPLPSHPRFPMQDLEGGSAVRVLTPQQLQALTDTLTGPTAALATYAAFCQAQQVLSGEPVTVTQVGAGWGAVHIIWMRGRAARQDCAAGMGLSAASRLDCIPGSAEAGSASACIAQQECHRHC